MARAPGSLPRTASVVIVGGGVIGTSCAFHLAEAGVESVVLLERNQLGSGSSGRAAGGVRAQFSDAINVALAQRSLSAFADFRRRPGFEIDLHRVGYPFALTREEDVPVFERDCAVIEDVGEVAGAGHRRPDADRLMFNRGLLDRASAARAGGARERREVSSVDAGQRRGCGDRHEKGREFPP